MWGTTNFIAKASNYPPAEPVTRCLTFKTVQISFAHSFAMPQDGHHIILHNMQVCLFHKISHFDIDYWLVTPLTQVSTTSLKTKHHLDNSMAKYYIHHKYFCLGSNNLLTRQGRIAQLYQSYFSKVEHPDDLKKPRFISLHTFSTWQ